MPADNPAYKDMALPKYYAVKRDRQHPRWEEFQKKFNSLYDEEWQFNAHEYYGYDGSPLCNGTDAWDSLSKFQNNPVALTIDEFFSALEAPEWTPKFGEVVEVKDHHHTEWQTRIFVASNDKVHYCVNEKDMWSYKDSGNFNAVRWNQIRPVPPPAKTHTVSIAGVRKALGLADDVQIEITD